MSVNEVIKKDIEINNTKLDGALTIINLNKNMEVLKEAVISELEKDEYNSIVTMDNFSAMKESSQFLGKVAKQISDFRIAKVKEETEDIKQFEDSLKEFTNMFNSKRDDIKKGLDVFEEQTRQRVKEVCTKYFNEYAYSVQLKEEFANKVNLEDMILTGYATATFSISKKGKEEVERRVNIQLNLQNKVENRLMQLENECLKAGIEPLTKQHIQGFLYVDDEEYQIKLRNLIVSEIERNRAVKEKAEIEVREKIEAEKQEFKNRQEIKVTESFEQTNFVKEEAKQELKTVSQDGSKVTKTLTCTIRVPATATNEQVINAVIKMIKEDKFPITNIKVD